MKKKRLKPSDYVHLHNHTQYSLLDGLTKIPELVRRVKEYGMEAVGISDHGTLSGVIELYTTAGANKIKPVIGMETYVAARSHTDKDPSKDKLNYHLILIAINDEGYKNLMKLSTIANLEGYYYKPRVDHELLEKYSEGIVVLSGCIGGELGDALRNDDMEKAKDIASWYKGVFGDRYYIEIQDHGHPDHPSSWEDQVRVTSKQLDLAKKLDIQCVLTSDAHYLDESDKEAHEILLCVQTGSFLSEENRFSLRNFDLHFEDPKEIIKRWGNKHPKLITNTKKIADMCDINIELGKILIPKFDVPKGMTEKKYLDLLVYQGLAWRYGNAKEDKAKKLSITQAKKKLTRQELERAEYELGIIESMGFNSYFLIIADFMNASKDKGIVFGPGRGSAAGSIVAYALKITELDPLHYNLLFERFLNPDRISMPDIDIDIQDSRRDEVIQYCVDKYGETNVANIVTFGTMAARNAVRDVARVLQVPYAEADRLAKMIPTPIQGRHIPLRKSLMNDLGLKEEYENNEQSKRVFDLATKLEGTIRSHGVHAAGVVIAPDEIVKFVPLEVAQKGVIATQYSMNPVDDLGLLKMDFLGLSNLTIIKNALRIIKKVHGKDININDIPLDDEETYDLFQRGDTTGVFQLESAGMKRYLKELKPTVFDDIIAMVALYRPGPMQFIDDFVARKHGKKEITFMHESMEPALKNTYGILVYQEQVMQISKEMCGFTGGQADTLRKAIGKKKMDVMAKMKIEFIEGAIKKVGADRLMMERFWKQLEDFAAYCFNKSHAACYGLIAYQTAYLKAHYPSAFMAALMTSDYDDTDRLAIEIAECQHMDIEVLPPDINESFLEFAVVPNKNQIRFGMNAIKGVGTGAVEEILRAREESSFESIEDFFRGVNTHIANRKTVEALVKSGAFDQFEDRAKLNHNLDNLISFGQQIQKQQDSGQIDLFGDLGANNDSKLTVSLQLEEGPKYNEREVLQWERDLLGIFISHHPLKAYETIFEEKAVPLSFVSKDYHGRSIESGGIIINFREIITKNGKKMAFVLLADRVDERELILFPRVYQDTIGLWEKDKVVMVKGKINAEDRDGNLIDGAKIMVDEAREVTLEQAKAYESTGKKPKKIRAGEKKPIKKQFKVNQKIYAKVKSSNDQELLQKIKTILDDSPGKTEFILVIGDGDDRQAIKLPNRVLENESLPKLKELLGSSNVKLN